jgi:hypothetical protein
LLRRAEALASIAAGANGSNGHRARANGR